MDYKKKYKEALERARNLYKDAIDMDENIRAKQCEIIFPELKESEGEKMRNWILDELRLSYKWAAGDIDRCEELLKAIAWLEKQGKKPKKVSIWKHWKDGIAGGAEDEQIFLIKIGRVYSISSCLGCECDYIELSELDKLMREEKQK